MSKRFTPETLVIVGIGVMGGIVKTRQKEPS
jgi:hypothetical protein